MKSKFNFFLPASGIMMFMVAFNASAAVSGDSSVDMSAVVSITSDDACALTVSKPGNTALTATWTNKPGQTPDKTFINTTADKAPMYISVATSGATNCALNNMKIITSTTASSDPGIEWLHQVNFGSLNGAWLFAPVLTDFKVYTDNSYGTAGTGNITIKSAVGDNFTVQSGVKRNEGDIGGGKYLMTNTYLVGGTYNIADMLEHGSNTGTITFSTDHSTELYKSARIGVGAVLSDNPIDRTTDSVNKNVAKDGDSATMNWTVTISEA
ncbi:hypothetical protein QUR14_004368 [Enterobacter hormaechei]|nr:hypothetical protein [Enterobacter hormaechei]